MILIALAFLAGHCLLHHQPQLPGLYPWCAVGLALAVVTMSLRRTPRMRFVGYVALAFMSGFVLADWHAGLRLNERWPMSRSGTDVELQGRVASIVEIRLEGSKFRLDVIGAEESVPHHVELTWYDTNSLPQPGELWRFRVRLRAPRGYANAGGYDYEAQLLRENIGATGYVRDAATNRLLAPARGYWVVRVRAAIAARIEAALPNSPMLGIVQGLTVGATTRMTVDQWRVFANTGTTHLMAISGMHIGMVALGLAWLAGALVRRLRLQPTRVSVFEIQAVVGMIAAACYSALAGFSVPTQRTFLMLSLFLCVRLVRRAMTAAHGLSLALITVLLVDPFAPLAAGFWLSFGAVAAIFLASAGGILSESRTKNYLRLQLVVTIGLTPLVIAAFGNVSLIAPLVNLLAIPFFTLLIVPLALIGSAILFVSHTAGGMILQGTVFLLERAWPLLEWASQLPLAMVSLPDPPAWAFSLLILGALALVAPGNLVTRFAGALLCLPALLWQPSRPRANEFELTVLDVGQGLAIVITTAEHVLVYDAGPSFRSGRDAGELVVVPFLRARGVRRIDTAMVSHGDDDHEGGLDSMRRSIQTDRLLLGPSVVPRASSEVCAAGQSWTWDGVKFEVLYPLATPASHRRNDSSCVLRITSSTGSAVLLGDVERAAEQWLVAHDVLQRADVVIVPHHGSSTSSSAALVGAIAPRYAVVSAGFGNQWGFPKSEVVARWRESGASVLQTAQTGAIEISITNDGVGLPNAYRAAERRYWRK
jgi:competence protein ComEC